MTNAQRVVSASPDLASLFKWQKTADFAQQVTQLDTLAGKQLLADKRWRSLTEALTLRDFAITLGFSDCRLCPKEVRFPDAELKFSGKNIQIEITEVMTPGRTRDKEYREFSECPSERREPNYEWEEIKKAGSSWVDWMLAGIQKKLKYDPKIKFDIVVYNNINHLFELPEIGKLSNAVGALLNEKGFTDHWVWQCRATTIDLLWPRLLRFQIPNWTDRF